LALQQNGASKAVHEAGRPGQMTQDEHPLDGTEWRELDPSNATLWGIVAGCLGLAILAFAWWLP
jgi:hypothetical protein